MKKLTEAQRDALISARDHDNPMHHLRGRSMYGGFTRTIRSLKHHGYLDWQDRITDAGRAILNQDSLNAR